MYDEHIELYTYLLLNCNYKYVIIPSSKKEEENIVTSIKVWIIGEVVGLGTRYGLLMKLISWELHLQQHLLHLDLSNGFLIRSHPAKSLTNMPSERHFWIFICCLGLIPFILPPARLAQSFTYCLINLLITTNSLPLAATLVMSLGRDIWMGRWGWWSVGRNRTGWRDWCAMQRIHFGIHHTIRKELNLDYIVTQNECKHLSSISVSGTSNSSTSCSSTDSVLSQPPPKLNNFC